jgi:biopolymer transport protein TolR
MGMSTGSKGGPIADINITPLVDVVLVLLIIFIVVAPQLQKGVEVQLPVTAKHKVPVEKVKKEEEKTITVSMKMGGELYLQKQQITDRAEFVRLLRSELQKPENAGKPVIIKGDARLTYGEVRRLMQDIQEVGLGGVSLAVKEDAQAKGEHTLKE